MSNAANVHPMRLSILAQARLVDGLVGRCVLRNGKAADETVLVITADEARHLHQLADRLHLMADHEHEIRRVVMGR